MCSGSFSAQGFEPTEIFVRKPASTTATTFDRRWRSLPPSALAAALGALLLERGEPPEEHGELALLLRGKPEKARPYLETALKAWSRADGDFRPAREARALAAELGMAP